MNRLQRKSKDNLFSGLKIILPVVVIFLAVKSFFILSCSPFEKKIDLKGIEPEIEILRLEKDLFEIDLDSVPEQLPLLKEEYGEFFEIFSNHIIGVGSSSSPAYHQHLANFLTDFDIYRVYTEVENIFPDLSELEDELENAFKHFMFYFPDYPVPQLYTFISGFNQSVVTAEAMLGIGLDKYLGRDHKYYAQLQIPFYQRYNMNPAKIPSDCMIAWAMSEFEFDNSDGNLLSHMIYQGKLLYFADAVLPGQHDTLKTGFSSSQLEWCRRNESQIWTYLVENKLLFSTDIMTISRFINEGPFTTAFSRESPARAAVWLGWQIVKSYMNRHKDVSLEDLMHDNDYQAILNRARYRP